MGRYSLLGLSFTWVTIGHWVFVGGGGCWFTVVEVWLGARVLLGLGLVAVGLSVGLRVGLRSRFTVRVGFCSMPVLLNISAISF